MTDFVSSFQTVLITLKTHYMVGELNKRISRLLSKSVNLKGKLLITLSSLVKIFLEFYVEMRTTNCTINSKYDFLLNLMEPDKAKIHEGKCIYFSHCIVSNTLHNAWNIGGLKIFHERIDKYLSV